MLYQRSSPLSSKSSSIATSVSIFKLMQSVSRQCTTFFTSCVLSFNFFVHPTTQLHRIASVTTSCSSGARRLQQRGKVQALKLPEVNRSSGPSAWNLLTVSQPMTSQRGWARCKGQSPLVLIWSHGRHDHAFFRVEDILNKHCCSNSC